MIPIGKEAARRPRWLGQSPGDWLARALRAVAEYDRLLKEAAAVADAEARGGILEWIGRADLPGSPAERYEAVRQDAVAGAGQFGEELAQRRVAQLEDVVSELSARVSGAIAAYGALPARGAGDAAEARTVALLFAGGLALLGLVIVPLLID